MFLLKRPLHAYTLYIFGRRMAAFRVQDLLGKLPLRFLTCRTARKTVPDLPDEIEKRLSAFLSYHGITARALAFYLSLYPDETGKQTADILTESVRILTVLPNETTAKEKKEAVDILKLFYALCSEKQTYRISPEHFEKWLNELSDFRLEAAALERLNDAFYEDDFVRFSLPDWNKTSKDGLTLNARPALFPLPETADRRKTAEGLVKTVTAMILRDGFMSIPTASSCRCDNAGNPHFIRADRFFALDNKERQIVLSCAEALTTGDFAAFFRTLRTAGLISSGDIVSLQKEFEKLKTADTLTEKADLLLSILTESSACIPFFIRYIARLLKETDHLCRFVLHTSAPWDIVRNDILQFLSRRKKISAGYTETAKDFKRAFSFNPHQKELTELRGKKLPSFQENQQKLSEMLSRQTVGSLFKTQHWHFRPVLLPTAIFLLIIWLCSQIK